ncbi:MAG: hypothetical protein GX455_13900 [Phycisphaerae bacterium]|nr:hypothetical protein [Phycisphaerae bacterium]
MRIRVEDKQVVIYIAMLGAVLGAGGCVLTLMNLAKKSHKQMDEVRQQMQVCASVLVIENLGGSDPDPTSKAIIDDQKRQIELHKVVLRDLEGQFWNRLPEWGLMAMCIGGGLAGLLSGFAVFWLIGLIGSGLLYSFIRLLYRIMRWIAPQSCDRPEVIAALRAGQQVSLRDSTRVLPTAIKISIFFLIASVILGLAMTLDFWPALR